MHNRCMSGHTLRSMLWLISGISVLRSVASGQVARIEVHPIETVTVTNQQFLNGDNSGKRVVIGGELQLPRGEGRFPAVILVHGSGGVGAREDRWAHELNELGIAVFILDTFTGRGIVQTNTDQSQLETLSIIGDVYRALTLLSKHPRIIASNIALMGFSKGGDVALRASMKRFQRMHAPPGIEFAAFIPFYAPCNTRYREDDQVTDRPIRMFHGSADNWVPVASCRDYVKRLQAGGKDIQLTEYSGAQHAFDNYLTPVREMADAQTSRRCSLEEAEGGIIINRETKRPFTLNDPCIERGAKLGYDVGATKEATNAVKLFLVSLWKLQVQ
jgi:dienelactone hydrolase